MPQEQKDKIKSIFHFFSTTDLQNTKQTYSIALPHIWRSHR